MHNDDAAHSAASDVALERLFEVAVVLDGAVEHGLADQGLTRARAEVIWRLAHTGSMTQRELSDALECTPRNVTGLVDALEASGLVERGAHPTDRRASLVVLTPRGSQEADRWQARFRDLGSDLFADLATADIEHLTGILEHLLPRVRDRTAHGASAAASD